MENFEEKSNSGELNGFDSADNNDTGSTETSEGGFYSKPKEEIIQDETFSPSNNENEESQHKNIDNENHKENSYNNNNFNGYYYTAPKPIKKPKKGKRFSLTTVVLSTVLAAIIGVVSSVAVIVTVLPNYLKNADNIDNKTENNVNINVDKTAENIVEAVAEKVMPSVVGIRTTTSVMNFFGGTNESSGDGSGVIISKNGYIVTNYHVIANALSSANSKIVVYLDTTDAEGYSASVVGYNISADLAVIKIDAKNLTAVEFSDSKKLKVGQYVITIGNPGGLEFMDSVTYGVISGLNRVVSSDSNVELIQTDAAINPGNSGGALVNAEGELVGINSSKIVSEEFEGMGFAIPSNTVKEICDEIIDRENSPEPFIGISISERYTADVLQYYGFPNGAVVLSVSEGSPADKAGIRKGDIITEYNNKEITDYKLLEDYIIQSKPGEKITVTVYRSGRYYTASITVGSNNAVN